MKNHKLDVYLNQSLAGQLSIDEDGDMVFIYHHNYIENKKNQPLSHSLPLQKQAYKAKQCRPFFGGILPEGDLRESIARQFGISKNNDFALLSAIGGDCAGAVSLLPSSSSADLKPDYQLIDDAELAKRLQNSPQKPLLSGETGARLSLAGAQDKLVIAIINEHIMIPKNGAPSTHIIKPANPDFPLLVENECFCLQLARKIGLNAVEASIHEVNGNPYLLLKRYDRIDTDKGIQRVHQEDFCQAMGMISEMKYEREGGPSIADCFQLIKQVSSVPAIDIKQLLQGIVFNLIIGNNDAHGKNFSLLYKNGQIQLTPFYDLISTVHYPALSSKMAMKIGGKYDFDFLLSRHIKKMTEDTDISWNFARQETIKIINAIKNNITESPFTEVILHRADKLDERLRGLSSL